MSAIPSISDAHLEGICSVLGETSKGLTGGEIGRLLLRCEIEDPCAHITKRDRLFAALAQRQRFDGCGNKVIHFIREAMSSALYRDKQAVFEERRTDLNEALIFVGLKCREDGSILKTTSARTLAEATERVGRLRRALQSRGVHDDVIVACRQEIIEQNTFHAVLEATKSLARKIRDKSGLDGDGAPLVDAAFGMAQQRLPVLAFNSLQTTNERGEHKGLANLLKGVFSSFRNPVAHETRTYGPPPNRISWILWRSPQAQSIESVGSLSLIGLDSAREHGVARSPSEAHDSFPRH
ncbi:MAG: TIGR02391 family protein [Planctomycetes bacterium]|nr:TIGR02391 family protein [Planctomycetota bacterium]